MVPAAAGGRIAFQPRRFRSCPPAEVDAPRAENRENAVVLSGIDTRFDQLFVQRMSEAVEGDDAVWLTASLSRISRNLGKLLRAMEYLLAHDVPILTANYLLRPHEAWVRRGELAPVDHEDLLAAWRVSRGLSGTHRATVAEVVKQLEAKGQPTATNAACPRGGLEPST